MAAFRFERRQGTYALLSDVQKRVNRPIPKGKVELAGFPGGGAFPSEDVVLRKPRPGDAMVQVVAIKYLEEQRQEVFGGAPRTRPEVRVTA